MRARDFKCAPQRCAVLRVGGGGSALPCMPAGLACRSRACGCACLAAAPGCPRAAWSQPPGWTAPCVQERPAAGRGMPRRRGSAVQGEEGRRGARVGWRAPLACRQGDGRCSLAPALLVHRRSPVAISRHSLPWPPALPAAQIIPCLQKQRKKLSKVCRREAARVEETRVSQARWLAGWPGLSPAGGAVWCHPAVPPPLKPRPSSRCCTHTHTHTHRRRASI